MDFFTAQTEALRKTRWLVFWFVLAVMGIIAVFYLLPALLRLPTNGRMASVIVFLILLCSFVVSKMYHLWESSKVDFLGLCVPVSVTIYLFISIIYIFYHPLSDKEIPRVSLLDGERLLWTCLIVGSFIALASLYKIRKLSRHGGTLVAEQLGGRMIPRNTQDPAERRLLNVIDETSIAAGIPTPVAFVLAEETGLNAFAAGLTIEDSIIGVTQGLLATMTRDELQGIVAHEISHIVNGDSRLNLRLIGILHGIYAITLLGRRTAMLDEERQMQQKRERPTYTLLWSGFILQAIGYIGFFFGRLIQTAVSREREYLADASAVQFTRNPNGLISALKKLHLLGSQIQHPQAIAASHLFFGASDTSAISLFATHPPLKERIARLGGKWVLPTLTAQPPIHATVRHHAAPALTDSNPPEEIPPANLNQAQILLASLPETLREQAHSVTGATGILAGLLFSRQSAIREQQEKLLPSDALPTAQELYQWLAEQPEHGARYRLIWLDLILPTLREALESERQELLALPAVRESLKAERQQLLALAKDLIRADGRVSPTEFALYSLLHGALLPPSERRVKQSELRQEQLDKDISDLLALLTYAGHDSVETAEAAYREAIASSPADTKHPIPAKSELSLNKISEALSHLALAAPPYRKKLLDACEVAIRHDGKITPVENELLRAFAQSLDCPALLAA